MTTNLERPKKVIVTVYPIAGKQLFFRVPDSFCRECELTLRAVTRTIAELDPGRESFEVQIKPWLNNVVQAVRRGGWHPPVVTINGDLFSQGIVPDQSKLRLALLEASANHAWAKQA
ncbi:MAG TPA: hypothetical protein VNL15_07165 [Dehalococcoidia bacterium]|nr:hypothetical protein [Dehalococcoidia bacterium]